MAAGDHARHAAPLNDCRQLAHDALARDRRFDNFCEAFAGSVVNDMEYAESPGAAQSIACEIETQALEMLRGSVIGARVSSAGLRPLRLRTLSRFRGTGGRTSQVHDLAFTPEHDRQQAIAKPADARSKFARNRSRADNYRHALACQQVLRRRDLEHRLRQRLHHFIATGSCARAPLQCRLGHRHPAELRLPIVKCRVADPVLPPHTLPRQVCGACRTVAA